MLVVADAGPLHYLILTGMSDILPHLFGTVVVPSVLRDELVRLRTPSVVKNVSVGAPTWLKVVDSSDGANSGHLAWLDPGERAVILLANHVGADLILMDDREGVATARATGLAVTGTLGLLDRAARRGLVDLQVTISALRQTNFHARPELFDRLLRTYLTAGRTAPPQK